MPTSRLMHAFVVVLLTTQCDFFQIQTTASRSCVGASAPAGVSRDDDSSRFHSTKKGNFHEVFNLSENERPLAGMGTDVDVGVGDK